MKRIYLHIGNVPKEFINDNNFLWLNDNQHPTLLLNDVIKSLIEGQEVFVTNNNFVLAYFTCLLQASRLNCLHINERYKTVIDSVDIIQYELDGTCNVLPRYKDWMPTDDNVCNNAVADSNDWYSDLLDFKQKLDNKKL